MNPDVKAKWVAALRSGEYQQARGQLRTNRGFCCLGVLCDLHAKETGGAWSAEFGLPIYLGEHGELPVTVRCWADLPYGNPRIGNHSAAIYNDGLGGIERRSFQDIADLIEEHL